MHPNNKENLLKFIDDLIDKMCVNPTQNQLMKNVINAQIGALTEKQFTDLQSEATNYLEKLKISGVSKNVFS